MYDVIVIGGGPAGLGAAIEAYQYGAKSVLILERDIEPGGILNQCIHSGFGLFEFKEELTGPEYAQRFIDMLFDTEIRVMLGTMVTSIDSKKMSVKIINENGCNELQAKAIVLATGSRERTSGAIALTGTRPSGVYTAGMVQKLINIEGFELGKNAVIYGSGDIGLIMARRLTLEGTKVNSVLEIMPHSSGLTRNLVQCLEDFEIPLLLSHKITQVHGEDHLEGITVSRVDENLKEIPGTEFYVECDLLLLSIGLIPENEVARSGGVVLDRLTGGPIVTDDMQTNVPGIFACGNTVHIHDIVDFVTEESRVAGKSAAEYALKSHFETDNNIEIRAGDGIRYALPQKMRCGVNGLTVFMRTKKVYRNIRIELRSGDKVLKSVRKLIAVPSEMIKIKLDGLSELNLGDIIEARVVEL